jgi:hypothetical protein
VNFIAAAAVVDAKILASEKITIFLYRAPVADLDVKSVGE